MPFWELNRVKIGVYFQEREISEIFAELMCSMGAQAEVLEDLKNFSSGTLEKVVTEPVFYSALPESFQKSCLLVGNKDALKRYPVQSLARPLTEEKVTQVLGQFLDS
jgi:hypothetical protein